MFIKLTQANTNGRILVINSEDIEHIKEMSKDTEILCKNNSYTVEECVTEIVLGLIL